MRTRLIALPAFDDLTDLADVLARSSFYLANAEPEELSILVAPEIAEAAEQMLATPTLPEGFDDSVAEAWRRMAPRVKFRRTDTIDIDQLSAHADFVIVWDEERLKTSDWAFERSLRVRGVSLFDVDRHRTRMESSIWCQLVERITRPSAADERERFEERTSELPRGTVTLFGTGPSISEAFDLDLSHGLRIVCNTMVLDDELMDHIRPQIVTFADPLHHFGPSIYAAKFRAAVRRRLASDPQLTAVIPIRYRTLLVALMPEAEEQIVGVPLLPADAPPNLDLTQRFGVTPYPNILTLFMIPLAAMFGHRIGLVGFDGRNPDDEFFWQHGERVQLHDEMDGIRRAHPAFFDVDYEDYYRTHVATLATIFQICEQRDIVVESLGHTYMPPLKRRDRRITLPSPMVPQFADSAPERLAVVIDPDWVDDFGHYGPWFKRLREALEPLDVPALSLASRAIAPSDVVVPTFTYPSTNPQAALMYAPSFEEELTGALRQLRTELPETELILAFYAANGHHLAPVIRAVDAVGGPISGVVNLMRAHPTVTEASTLASAKTEAWSWAMGELVASASERGIAVAGDTGAFAELFTDLTGASIAIWPMASAAPVNVSLTTETPSQLVVYCPAQSQEAKGVREFIRAVELVMAEGELDATFRMRRVDQPTGMSRVVVAALEHAEELGVDVVHGGVDDDSYARLIETADVVVVPYRVDTFRTRTSSVVVEAGLAGKPVVAASGTWGAGVATDGGFGVEFISGDARDLARAISEAVTRHAELQARAIEAAPALAEQFSMKHLARFLTSTNDRPANGPPTVDVAVAEMMLLAVEEGRRIGAALTAPRVHDLLSGWMRDNMRIDYLLRTNDQLRRGIAFRDRKVSDLSEVVRGESSLKKEISARDSEIEELSKRPVNRLIGAFRRRLGGGSQS